MIIQKDVRSGAMHLKSPGKINREGQRAGHLLFRTCTEAQAIGALETAIAWLQASAFKHNDQLQTFNGDIRYGACQFWLRCLDVRLYLPSNVTGNTVASYR